MNNYDDIINLPHYEPRHPRMSPLARAAQFAPFDALTGYGDAVKETARRTDKKIELDESEKSILDNKIQILKTHIFDCPEVSITYFIQDTKKSGGVYETITGNLIKIDTYKNTLVLEDKTKIPIIDIIDINSSLINNIEY